MAEVEFGFYHGRENVDGTPADLLANSRIARLASDPNSQGFRVEGEHLMQYETVGVVRKWWVVGSVFKGTEALHAHLKAVGLYYDGPSHRELPSREYYEKAGLL